MNAHRNSRMRIANDPGNAIPVRERGALGGTGGTETPKCEIEVYSGSSGPFSPLFVGVEQEVEHLCPGITGLREGRKEVVHPITDHITSHHVMDSTMCQCGVVCEITPYR